MRVEYDKETDSLYIRLGKKGVKIVNSAEVEPGLVCDFAENGDVVGLDIENASNRVDLDRIEFGSQQILIS